ncbi:MAG: hypothetical protein LBH07_02400 [Treponema sp.]|jgi:hypothetical protein|nr:hypothetical protein [Treponema sp.]
MEITINGKAADIILESEKTAGEVIKGIHEWLANLDLFVSGLEIDGKTYGSLSMDKAFDLPLDNISSIEVKTSNWAELMLEALTSLKQDLKLYKSQEKEEQENYLRQWKETAPAHFLKDHGQDIYSIILSTMGNGSFSEDLLGGLVSERIREIEDPSLEMNKLKPTVEEITGKLEELPLDMQTGKDQRASETIVLFSSLVEKIFRLIFLFQYFQTDINSIETPIMNGSKKLTLKEYLDEFSTALKELISAYENKDTVMVGDMAEYELAPRLRCLTSILCTISPGEMPG